MVERKHGRAAAGETFHVTIATITNTTTAAAAATTTIHEKGGTAAFDRVRQFVRF
jgi:hypothetical protein